MRASCGRSCARAPPAAPHCRAMAPAAAAALCRPRSQRSRRSRAPSTSTSTAAQAGARGRRRASQGCCPWRRRKNARLGGAPEVVQRVEGHVQQLVRLAQAVPGAVVARVQVHRAPVRLCTRAPAFGPHSFALGAPGAQPGGASSPLWHAGRYAEQAHDTSRRARARQRGPAAARRGSRQGGAGARISADKAGMRRPRGPGQGRPASNAAELAVRPARSATHAAGRMQGNHECDAASPRVQSCPDAKSAGGHRRPPQGLGLGPGAAGGRAYGGGRVLHLHVLVAHQRPGRQVVPIELQRAPEVEHRLRAPQRARAGPPERTARRPAGRAADTWPAPCCCAQSGR